MTKEYDTFVYSLKELKEGQELTLAIRDLTPGTHKYETTFVRAIVSSSPTGQPQEGKLWVIFNTGVTHPKPYYINVLENLGSTVPGKPSPR